MSKYISIKCALISCWDKAGILELGSQLDKKGVEIISTGGTARFFTENGIKVTKVEEITGFNEMLDGRVKSLHPHIHGAILAKRTPKYLSQLRENNIKPIDLVVINLYPFIEKMKSGESDIDQMVEFIDIGGPAMLRAAAKNFENVTVLNHPNSYREFLEVWKRNNYSIPVEYSQKLASDAFYYTAYYDSQIAAYLDSKIEQTLLPKRFSRFYIKRENLRYGENPHQQAALYQSYEKPEVDSAKISQLWGKEMSYNNYVDVTSAAKLVYEFNEPTIAIIKHTNPCGVAVDQKLTIAFQKALASDPISAFGGIVAANIPIDGETAKMITKYFFECIVCSSFENEALEILKRKKNLRLIKMDSSDLNSEDLEFKFLPIGLLSQQQDTINFLDKELRSVGHRAPTKQEQEDLIFAWKVVKHVKSNAIVFAKSGQVIGIGAGQMSRVDAVKLAYQKSIQFKHKLSGSVMASDAFFPFRDGVDEAHKAGITAVIQPGGSIRDDEVIAAVKEHNMAMLLTGVRHFKH